MKINVWRMTKLPARTIGDRHFPKWPYRRPSVRFNRTPRGNVLMLCLRWWTVRFVWRSGDSL